MGNESNKSIRIRVNNNSDSYITTQLTQDFDMLNVMSLTLTQDDVYTTPVANYGIIVGRVTVNGGIGVPNAKVSIFIPLDEEDSLNEVISYIYPYKTTTDKNVNGLRYNLLPNSKQHYYHSPVGSFPSRDEIVCNPELEYVYKKYYKYVVSTNASGDYMITNVPVGEHTIFMDCDISDIGELSQKPYDLIYAGYNETMFDSKTKFKQIGVLDSLPQVYSQTEVINVKPFWGDQTIADTVGINKKNFEINYKLTPTCLFIGSMGSYSDNGNTDNGWTETFIRTDGSVTYRWIHSGYDRGHSFDSDRVYKSTGTVEVCLLQEDGTIKYVTENNGYVIDNHGCWILQIPMDSGWKTTSEGGELVDSVKGVGIPTLSSARFRFGGDRNNTSLTQQTAYYVVPTDTREDPNNIDVRFTQLDFNKEPISTQKPFNGVKLEWNKIYTVKSTMPNYVRDVRDWILNISAIPNTSGVRNQFPFNFDAGSRIFDKDLGPQKIGRSFVGIINGFLFFTPFEVSGGSFCDAKKFYNISTLRIGDSYNNWNEKSDRRGFVYNNEETSEKFYFYQSMYNPGDRVSNLNINYCGIVEIGKTNPKINTADLLPPPTSANANSGGSEQCNVYHNELGISVTNQDSVTNDDIIQKQQRSIMMELCGEGVDNINITNSESDLWYGVSNVNPMDGNYNYFKRTRNSLFHYYGIDKGNTAIDRLINEYILVKE